jgi:ATP-binding cassette, subfamily C, bacterial CydC
MRPLLALAGAPRRRVALAAALGTLTVACGAGLMATAGYLIARAAERPEVLALTTTIVTVRFFALCRPLARYGERLASHDLALRGLGRIRERFFARIEPLAPAGLESYRRGDLLSRMVADVDALEGLYVRGLLPPLVALGSTILVVAVTAAFLPAAAAILAAGLVLAGAGVPALTGTLARRSGHRQAPERARLTAELVELLQGGAELAAYGREDERLARVRARDHDLTALARRDARIAGLGDALVVLIAGATTAAVLAAAVAAVHAGALDRVLVVMLPLLALASFEGVAGLPGAARELPGILASGGRVLELTSRRAAVHDPTRPLPPPAGVPELALEGVRVRYSRRARAVLDGFDLRLEPGARVALVGPSGAGKTTVVNLLLRFLDPEAGRVTLAGHDLRAYRQQDVRGMIAVAGQDAHIFATTIADNVRLARPDATDEEVRDALRAAGLPDWVDALETYVGEAGAQLSGGERQRLAVARALLARAPILILDEPTAHLDADTARRLMDDVFAAAGERSVLLITHRPEGLEQVQQVVALPPAAGGTRSTSSSGTAARAG